MKKWGGWGISALIGFLASQAAPVLAGPNESSTEEVLNSLRRVRPGQIETYYFEAKQGGDTVGYAIVSLRGAHAHGEQVIKYKNESSVKVDEKSRLTLIANAMLKYNFEPITIEIGGTVNTPAGVRRTPKLKISVNDVDNEITVLAVPPLIAKDKKLEPRHVPKPRGHFLYALDALIHFIDFDKHKAFKIPEYIPQSGDVFDLTYKVEKQANGTMIVNTIRYDGEQDYKFWFDKSGKLDRWGEPPFDLLLHRSNKDVVRKLKAGYEKESAQAKPATRK